MRTEPHFDRGRTEPINNEDVLVLYLNDNGKLQNKWMDRSGQNNHGTVYGAGTPPPATPGSLGYTFDGLDDYVDCGNAASLNVATALTVSVWVKVNTMTAAYHSIMQRVTGVGYALNLYQYEIRPTLNSGGYWWSSGYNLTPSVWAHVIYTATKSGEWLYVNGALVANTTGHAFSVSSQNLYIGGTGTAFVSGSIDEVLIYNRALSASEITQLFQTTRGKFGI